MTEVLASLLESVWLRSELISAGHTDRELARLVRVGVLRRVRRGAYVDGATYDAADATSRHRLVATAVVKQAKTDVIVSHSSAVPFHAGPTWGLHLDKIHVTRPDGRAGRAEAGVRQHQGALRDEEVVSLLGLEVTSATRTALDVTTCASAEASLVLMNDLLHRRLTTLAELRARYAGMEHHPHTLRTDLVLRLADPRLESVGESRTYFLCYRGGVPAPTPQFEVLDDAGRVVARLDFAWPERGVWVEFDGLEKYVQYRRKGESMVDVVLREKKRESMIAGMTGWRCVRLTWSDLERPAETVAQIRAALGLAPGVTPFT